ncbi:hypothetical protein CR513_25751, partial [Mucuna pruriens]
MSKAKQHYENNLLTCRKFLLIHQKLSQDSLVPEPSTIATNEQQPGGKVCIAVLTMTNQRVFFLFQLDIMTQKHSHPIRSLTLEP